MIQHLDLIFSQTYKTNVVYCNYILHECRALVIRFGTFLIISFEFSSGLNVQSERKPPTISLVHKGTLRRVWDALPNGDGFGITRVHTPDVLIVPPVPEPEREVSEWKVILTFETLDKHPHTVYYL